MKANELRIGNYIEYKKGHQGTASAIDDQGYVEVNNSYLKDGVFEITQFRPIPLTEEWLLKFGFVEKDTNYDGGHHYWQLQDGDVLLTTPFEDATSVDLDGFNITVEHVHTLQNLYFALTGEELTIKE